MIAWEYNLFEILSRGASGDVGGETNGDLLIQLCLKGGFGVSYIISFPLKVGRDIRKLPSY